MLPLKNECFRKKTNASHAKDRLCRRRSLVMKPLGKQSKGFRLNTRSKLLVKFLAKALDAGLPIVHMGSRDGCVQNKAEVKPQVPSYPSNKKKKKKKHKQHHHREID